MSYSDDRNYYSDHRVRARERGNWYVHLDSNKMKATILLFDENGDEEEVEVPFHYEVCETCRGKGTHVNPSIDAGGLSAEDFYEDPDFADSYMEGVYDVGCYECGGNRVVPVINRDATEKSILERIDEKSRDEAQYRAEVEAERRFGC